MTELLIQRGAQMAGPSDIYRRTLWRTWDPSKLSLGFIMLNPSTADGETDDQTIRVCMGRAQRMGYGGIKVSNLFMFRATFPIDLKKAADPIGPDWEQALLTAVTFPCGMTIAAWGDDGWNMDGGKTVTKVIEMVTQDYGRDLYALALTKAGQPKHPARLAYELQPFVWKERRPERPYKPAFGHPVRSEGIR
ncbi:MAG TPA: DUF1643 domain-containing protein [Terriglobia bacterium]|nr:DUF1643 domain-containing protein [Terriglobia bacterium]